MFEKIKNFRLLIIITIMLVGFGVLAMTPQNKPNVNKKPSVLSIELIKNDIANNGQLIDVRTSEEYAAGHIDGSINLSLQDIQAGKYPTAAKDKPIYIYCRSGNRSGQAKTLLKSSGYKNITDLGAIAYVQSLGGIIKKS